MDITLNVLLLGLGDDSGRQWETHGLYRKLWFEGPATLTKINLPRDEFFYLPCRGEESLSGSPYPALGTCPVRARSYLSLWRAGVEPNPGLPHC